MLVVMPKVFSVLSEDELNARNERQGSKKQDDAKTL